MKRFLLVVMLFASAASLYAAELKVSGDMNVRGVMDGFDTDTKDYSYNFFDYDLTIDMAFVANENATVFTKLALDKTVSGTGYVDFAEEDYIAAEKNTTYLSLERAYLNYKFAPFAQLNTGLMDGGQWATAFGDKEVNVMRVQLIGALSEDMIFILTYQKDNEVGKLALDTDNNEKDDQTTYYAAAKLKFGGIEVLPLLTYVQKGMNYNDELILHPLINAGDTFDVTVFAFTLGLNGDFGMVGFEFEGCYKYTMWDDIMARDDAAAYGAYLNVFAKLGIAKVGAAVAYASLTDDNGFTGYEMGDDFDFTMVADDLVLGETYDPAAGYVYGGLVGMTAFKLYGEATVIEKLTLGGCFAYGMSSDDDVQDASFWEVDLKAAWAFDANTTYSVAFGYADISGDSTDEGATYRLYHKFDVKF